MTSKPSTFALVLVSVLFFPSRARSEESAQTQSAPTSSATALFSSAGSVSLTPCGGPEIVRLPVSCGLRSDAINGRLGRLPLGQTPQATGAGWKMVVFSLVVTGALMTTLAALPASAWR